LAWKRLTAADGSELSTIASAGGSQRALAGWVAGRVAHV